MRQPFTGDICSMVGRCSVTCLLRKRSVQRSQALQPHLPCFLRACPARRPLPPHLAAALQRTRHAQMQLERRLSTLSPDHDLVHQRNSRVFDLVRAVWLPLCCLGGSQHWPACALLARLLPRVAPTTAADPDAPPTCPFSHSSYPQVREASLPAEHWQESYHRLVQVGAGPLVARWGCASLAPACFLPSLSVDLQLASTMHHVQVHVPRHS